MKKIIRLLVLSLVIFSFVACSCNCHTKTNEEEKQNEEETAMSNTALLRNVAYRPFDIVGDQTVSGKSDSLRNDSVFLKMPSSVEGFAYVNLKGVRSMGGLSDTIIDGMDMPEDISDIFDYIDEVYFGADDIKGEDIFSPDEGNYVAILKGSKFNKKSIKKALSKENPDLRDATFNGVEALTSEDSEVTLLFIDGSTSIIVSSGFETKVVNAYIKGRDTVSKNSKGYKAIKSMRSNLVSVVADLSGMGKVDLSEMPGGFLQGETVFGLTQFGLSLNSGDFVADFSSVLDSSDATSEVANSLNGLIMMGRMMISQVEQMPISESAKNDIKSLLTKTMFSANGRTLSISVSIKKSTIEEVLKAMDGQL